MKKFYFYLLVIMPLALTATTQNLITQNAYAASGSISVVLGPNVTIPNTTETLDSSYYEISGNRLLVKHYNTDYYPGYIDGLYVSNMGKLSTLVDINTNIPGTTVKVEKILEYAFDETNIVFLVQGKDYAAYAILVFDGASIKTIANTSTNVPGTNKRFTHFRYTKIKGRTVCFEGYSSDSYEGIFAYTF
jgi:hypothetical protein